MAIITHGLLLTVEGALFYLRITSVAADTVRSEVRVWSIDVGPEIYVKPVGIRRPTCLSLPVAVLTDIEIMFVLAAFRTIWKAEGQIRLRQGEDFGSLQ